jgi:hypothetical protein
VGGKGAEVGVGQIRLCLLREINVSEVQRAGKCVRGA